MATEHKALSVAIVDLVAVDKAEQVGPALLKSHTCKYRIRNGIVFKL
jgi:hypothetical protein